MEPITVPLRTKHWISHKPSQQNVCVTQESKSVTLLWNKTAAQYCLALLMDAQASEDVLIIISSLVTPSSSLEVLSGRETLEAEPVLPEPQPLTVGRKANLLRWWEETESRRRTRRRSSAPRTRALWEQEPSPPMCGWFAWSAEC